MLPLQRDGLWAGASQARGDCVESPHPLVERRKISSNEFSFCSTVVRTTSRTLLCIRPYHVVISRCRFNSSVLGADYMGKENMWVWAWRITLSTGVQAKKCVFGHSRYTFIESYDCMSLHAQMDRHGFLRTGTLVGRSQLLRESTHTTPCR